MNMISKPEAVLLDDEAIQLPGRFQVHVDRSRDDLLTEFGNATLNDRYLLPGEAYQDLSSPASPPTTRTIHRIIPRHAQRLYDYISKLWFMPATPGPLQRRHRPRPADLLLPQRGQRTACNGIVGLWNENVWLAARRRRHRLLLGQPALDRRDA